MKTQPLSASLDFFRVPHLSTAALLVILGVGLGCSSSAPNPGVAPNTGGSGGSGSGNSGSGNGGSGHSGSNTGGSGHSAAGRGGSGGSGSGKSGNGGTGNGGTGHGGTGNGGTGHGGSSAGSSGANNLAGANSGGAAGKGGGSAAGASGGPGVSFQCDPIAGGPVGTPNDCTPVNHSDQCQSCVQAHCCAEYAACYATDPGNQCGWGGPAQIKGSPNYGGEITCMQACLIAASADSGTAPTSAQVNSCAHACATSLSNGATKECGQLLGAQTSTLVECLLNSCSPACFGN